MAAPAISRDSGDASPAAPISAAMVSVVAAVGATLGIEAIQSPRSPTDLSASPADVSFAISQNPFLSNGPLFQAQSQWAALRRQAADGGLSRGRHAEPGRAGLRLNQAGGEAIEPFERDRRPVHLLHRVRPRNRLQMEAARIHRLRVAQPELGVQGSADR